MMEHYNFMQARQAWANKMTEPYKEGTMIPNEMTAKQDPPIAVEFELLEKNISYLRSCLQELEVKIAPVLAEPSPAPETLGKDPRGTSPVLHRVRSFNAEIHDLTARINDLTRRLEL